MIGAAELFEQVAGKGQHEHIFVATAPMAVTSSWLLNFMVRSRNPSGPSVVQSNGSTLPMNGSNGVATSSYAQRSGATATRSRCWTGSPDGWPYKERPNDHVHRLTPPADGLDLVGADQVVFDIAEAEGPFDVILESVGGASLAGAVRLVAPQGAVIVFGNSSGEPPRSASAILSDARTPDSKGSSSTRALSLLASPWVAPTLHGPFRRVWKRWPALHSPQIATACEEMGIDVTYHQNGRVLVESRPRVVNDGVGGGTSTPSTRDPWEAWLVTV